MTLKEHIKEITLMTDGETPRAYYWRDASNDVLPRTEFIEEQGVSTLVRKIELPKTKGELVVRVSQDGSIPIEKRKETAYAEIVKQLVTLCE